MKTLRQIAILILVTAALGRAADDMSTDATEVPIQFVVIGDRTGSHTEGIYGEVLQEIVRLRPEFVMTVGDMIEGYTEDTTVMISEWDEYMRIVGDLPMPIHYTPGNHDITTQAMEAMYRRYAGEPYYSFDYRGAHFVVLNNSAGGGARDAVSLPDEQYQWLAADLESRPANEMILIFCHKPFWVNVLPYGRSHRLHSLFVRTGVDAVMSGHFHDYFSSVFDGVLYASIGSSGGGMRPDAGGLGYQFAWVTVSRDSVWLSPIRKGSVLPTDYMTSEDLHLSQAMERLILTQPTPAYLIGRSNAAVTVDVLVRNFSPSSALTDTLYWTVPEGWHIAPEAAPVSVAPDGQQLLSFQADCSGELYPLPSVSLTAPLRVGREIRVTRDLRLGRTVTCKHATPAPDIDGALDESIWIDPITELYTGDYQPSEVDSTEFYFAADSLNFYLAARCFESRPDSIVANVRDRDGAIYGEDCVGYFLAPQFDGDSVFQIYVNPRGVIFDQSIVYVGGGYATDLEFDGDYEIATAIFDNGWTVEMRIPFATLNGAAGTSKDWGVNFRRKQKRLGASAEWLTPLDYDPLTFGRLRLPLE
ncbi:MAG: metallophosphoesterase [bacterium]